MEKIKLGDLCNPCQGQIKVQPGTIIDYIDISSIDNNSKTVSGYQTMTFAEAPSRARKAVKKGNILVSTVRPNLNAVAIVEDATPNMTVASTGFCVLDCKENVDKRFVLNFCKSKAFIDEMVAQATGASYPAVSDKIVRAALVPSYSFHDQIKIGEILDKVSLIIAKRKSELTYLDNLVKARFVEVFGEPIANPMKWPVKRLKELSTLITNGNTPKGGRENYVESGILFLRSQNVWRNRIELDDVAFIDEATHKSMRKSSLRHKDILITKTGRINTENSSLGRAALFLGADYSANINGHVYLVRLNGTIVPEFVVTILTGEAYRRYIRKVCVGGIDKRQINVDQVEDFPIIIPPYEQQKQFAAFVAQVDKSKAVMQKSLEEAQLLFDSLMQQYFG